MTLFRWFIARSLRQQPLRSVATVFSLAVGVAVVVAIQLANASSLRGFSTVMDAMAGRTSLEITAPGVGIREARATSLGWLRDYGRVSPVIDADILLAPVTAVATEQFEVVRLLGVDILSDRPFRDYQLVNGETPRRVTTQEFLSLLTDPYAVVLTDQFARRYKLAVNDPVTLLVGDRIVPLRVAGILGEEGPASVLDGNFALMDIAAAQWALNRLGQIDRIDVRLTDGISIDQAEQEIATRLPDGLGVRRPERRGAEVERMLRAFHFNLTALSFIALLVGLFLVYNTVSVSVITRRHEIGLLRTVGAGRSTIVRLFLGEATLLAVAGSAIGAPLGWLLAQGAVRLTSSTVSQFWVASAAQVPPLSLEMVGFAFVVGVPLAIIGAFVPVREASRITPMAALRGDAALEARNRLSRRFLVVPVVLFVLAAWFVRQEPIDGLPIFGLLASLAVVFGAAVLMPAVLFGFRRFCGGAMSRWLHVEGHMAHANLGSAIPRLSISVAALAVSLAMMVAIAIMVGSFRETVVYWVGQTLQADLFVSSARSSPQGSVISSETETLISNHPDVVAVDVFTTIDVNYAETPIVIGAGRFEVLLDHGALLFKAPDNGPAAMATAVGVDAVVVSEAFSLKHRVAVGDTIVLPTPQGETPFRVVAVYFDYSNDRGLVVMDVGTFARHFEAGRPSGLMVYLAPEANPDTVRNELRDGLGNGRPVLITTNASLRREVLQIFDSTFVITYALEVIAVAVSMFGVAATLLTLVLERRHELAMLRLVGAERGQVRRMIVIEAGILGVLTHGVGLVVGFVLSLILIYVINVQSFGWTIQFHVPIVFLGQSTLAILVATAIAGLYPARLASRFSLRDVAGFQG
ncbi:MAG TPA: FtsX-like permease family protein [Acidobacteria bacterium]|nr:FtsX-like permease family protein [Acidobacteriota bacterium]